MRYNLRIALFPYAGIIQIRLKGVISARIIKAPHYFDTKLGLFSEKEKPREKLAKYRAYEQY